MSDFGCPGGELVLTVEQGRDRERWLAERRKGIGGSDIAMLMGDSTYGTDFDVWLDKTGRTPDKEQSLPMEMGVRFEAAVAEKFSEDRGLEIRRRGMLRSKIEPTLFCNADRLSSDGKAVEVKVVNGFMKMPPEDDGTDPFCGWPRAWFWQGVGVIFVTGRAGCHLVVAIGNQDFVVRTLYRDDERVQAAIARVLEVVPAWWDKHIVGGEAPPMSLPDVPDMATVLAGSKWEAPIPEMARDWRDRVKELRTAARDIKSELEVLKAKIDAEAGGVEWVLADGRPVLRFNPVSGRASFKKAALFANAPIGGFDMTKWIGEADWLDDEQSSRIIAYLLEHKLTEAQFTTRGAPSRSLLIVGDADTKED